TLLDFYKPKPLDDEEREPKRLKETESDAIPSTSGSNSQEQDLLSYDIGLAVDKKMLNDNERLKFLKETWKPDRNYVFPCQQEGKQVRKFCYGWFERFNWLSYSQYKSGAFCKMCVLFAPMGAGVGCQPLKTLVNQPLTKFKKALDMLHHHESSQYHKFSVQKSAGFSIVNSGKNANIVLQLDQAKLDIIEANKKRLRPIVKSIIFCAHNNIPLRGHRDDGELVVQEYQNTVIPNNQGVFRNLLLFRLDSGDVDLQSHFENTGKNCTMISKT
ncbi:unnamed protein product, partial [Phaedon cochleariae]